MKDFYQFLKEQNEIKLWLDDIRPMPNNFNYHVKTAHEAIDILKTGNVIEISLDNDLGPEEAGIGYDVAKYIEEQAFLGNLPKIIWHIHSSNIVGVKNMQMALQNADKFWNKNEF